MVENQCQLLRKWEESTKVQKLLANEEKIQQAQKVVVFYKQQVQQIDGEIRKILQKGEGVDESREQSQPNSSAYNYTLEQAQQKQD
jgi:hypothetical protein